MNSLSSSAMEPPHNTPLLLLGPSSTLVECPFCHNNVNSFVQYTNNTCTHIAAAAWAKLWCCCIPYCSESAKNADHYCPKCNRYIGTHRK